MDLPNDDPNAGSYRSRFTTVTLEDGPITEARSPQTPPKLQKKRSNAGVRAASQPQPSATGTDNPSTPGQYNGERGVQKARKGSIRNAVRKLFGRRSRDAEPPAPQRTPPRHGYHRSEPYTGLSTQPEVVEDTAQEQDYMHRTFSAPIAPIRILPSAAVQRTRSPYAVEFPQSAKLKPLNLGNPYTAPGSQLRRRKTLPSILMPDSDDGPAPTSPAIPEIPGDDEGEIGRAVSTDLKREKRRSRSAGDLKAAQAVANETRDRNEEIRYWRESFQPSVLRASGFTVPVRDADDLFVPDEDRTPMAATTDPFGNGRTDSLPLRSSPPQRGGLGVSEADYVSPSAMGSNLSQDIEDRVARLEAGLRSFRGELAQMAADRNRRTVLIGGVPTPSSRRRGSSPGRTASILAETLQTDLAPSDYPYDYTDTLRPSTSPQPPRTPPVRYTGPSPGQATRASPRTQRRADEDPFTTTPTPPRPSTSGDAQRSTAPPPQNSEPLLPPPPQPQQYTFRSLYEMLADERSARRRLEIQMRSLRDEIANLHYQVSNVSQVQSQRSSYYAAMDPMVGSSRLHALLRDTGEGESPPRDVQGGRLRDSRGIAIDPRVISRFSGSESEVAGEEAEPETPYEVYQTPTEEAMGDGPFHARTGATASGGVGDAAREGQMF